MQQPMTTRPGPVGRVRSWVRGTLWALPTLGVVVAVVAGVVLPRLERSWQDGSAAPFLFGGGAAAARDSLSVIAGSLISVTGLVFSLTMIALQLGSSQYSPRVLRTFAADPYVRWTLTLLVLTFTFALVVLRTVRSGTAESTAIGVEAFVPRFSVTLSFLLALASVLAVVLFLGHLARSLRVETMLRELHVDAERTMRSQLAKSSDAAGAEPAHEARRPRVHGPAVPLLAGSSGFLVDIDDEGLARVAHVRRRAGRGVAAVSCAAGDTAGLREARRPGHRAQPPHDGRRRRARAVARGQRSDDRRPCARPHRGGGGRSAGRAPGRARAARSRRRDARRAARMGARGAAAAGHRGAAAVRGRPAGGAARARAAAARRGLARPRRRGRRPAHRPGARRRGEAAASTSVVAAERDRWILDVEDALHRRWRVERPPGWADLVVEG